MRPATSSPRATASRPAAQAPTDSWVAGEYVTDAHQLTLQNNAGLLRLLVGMYDPAGQRLVPSEPAPGESGAVLLTQIEP